MNTPTDIDTVSGASFPLVIQCLSTVLVASIGVAAWAGRASLAPWFESMQWMALCVAVSAMVMWGYLNILFSRTSLGPAGLSQGWLLQTRVPLTDITEQGLYAVQRYDRGSLGFEGGLRLDNRSLDSVAGERDFSNVSASAGVTGRRLIIASRQVI